MKSPNRPWSPNNYQQPRPAIYVTSLAAPELAESSPAAAPAVLGHNIETVPRLYDAVRPQADYVRSLQLLAEVRRIAPQLPIKSGLMLGLGEDRHEVLAVLNDLHAAGVSLLTLGQYLAPSAEHLPVLRYLPPPEFAELAAAARNIGFSSIEAGPLVRSSYHAAEQYEEGFHA